MTHLSSNAFEHEVRVFLISGVRTTWQGWNAGLFLTIYPCHPSSFCKVIAKHLKTLVSFKLVAHSPHITHIRSLFRTLLISSRKISKEWFRWKSKTTEWWVPESLFTLDSRHHLQLQELLKSRNYNEESQLSNATMKAQASYQSVVLVPWKRHRVLFTASCLYYIIGLSATKTYV